MKEKIVELLEDIIPDCDVCNTADLIGEGYLTSFSIMQLVVALSDEFDVEITPVDIVPENFKNIDTIRIAKEIRNMANDYIQLKCNE